MQFLRDFLNDGPKRIEARDKWVGENVMPFVPPELRQWLTVGDAINPVSDIRRAGEKARVVANPDRTTPERVGALGDVLVDSASVLAPAAAAKYSGKAAQGVVDALAMASMPADDAAQRFVADQSGAFAGVRAKTADLGALKRAEDMTAAGASRDDIWRDTGWFQGVDGKWRFEIDDSKAGLTPKVLDAYANPGAHGHVPRIESGISDVFDHPQLFESYPGDDKFYPLSWGDATLSKAATPEGAYMDNGAIRSFAPDEKTHRSILLHELQHGIQNQEGFARGGNLTDGAAIARDEAAGKYTRLEDVLAKAYERLSPEQAKTWNNYLFGSRVAGEDVINASGDTTLLGMLRRAQEIDRLREISYAPDQEDILRSYRRLAGETEARNVQRRAGWNMEGRREIPPWETQDVPDEQQIVRMGDAIREGAPDRLKNYLNQ